MQPTQEQIQARIGELTGTWVEVPGMPGVSVLRDGARRVSASPRVAVSDATTRAIAAAWGAELPSAELLDYLHSHPSTTRIKVGWVSALETPQAFSVRADAELRKLALDPSRFVSGLGKAWIAGPSPRNFGWYHPSAPSRSPAGLPVYQSVGKQHNQWHWDYSQQLHLVRYAPGASRKIPMPTPTPTNAGTGFASDRAAVIAALTHVLGQAPTIGEAAYLHAVVQHETQMGRGWQTAAGRSSNNTGAVMLAPVTRYGLTQADFPAPLRSNLGTTDHELTPDGSGFAYLDGRPNLEWRYFRRYPSLEEGLVHNAGVLYVDSTAHPTRHVTKDRAAALDLRGVVEAQKAAGYFEATVADYLSAVTAVLRGWASAGHGDPFRVAAAPSTPRKNGAVAVALVSSVAVSALIVGAVWVRMR